MILSYERGETVDTVEFDVTLRESFPATADVPTRPVEAGADVADHVVPGAQQFSATVVVTDTPITQPVTQMYGVVGTLEQQEIALGAISQMRRGANGSTGAGAENERSSVGAQITTLQWSEPFSRVERVLEVLETIRLEALRCSVFTAIREFDDLYLTRVSPVRTRTRSIEIGLDFTQVRVAASQTVQLPEPEEPRARPGRDAGRQRTTQVTDAVTQDRARSALSAVVDALAGGA